VSLDDEDDCTTAVLDGAWTRALADHPSDSSCVAALHRADRAVPLSHLALRRRQS
jgi:hypothetical protein